MTEQEAAVDRWQKLLRASEECFWGACPLQLRNVVGVQGQCSCEGLMPLRR